MESCVWTESVKDMAKIEWQMLPKPAAMSEVDAGWEALKRMVLPCESPVLGIALHGFSCYF